MLMRSATLACFAIFAHAIEDGISCSGGQCTHDGEGDEVGLLSVRTASKFGPLPPSPTPPQPQLCDPHLKVIDNADDYKTAWEAQGHASTNKKLPACVSPELFGCFFQCDQDSLYGGSEKAWISPNENLMQYLYLQHLYGAEHPNKVAAGAFIIVGFGPPGLAEDVPGYCLGVFTLPLPGTAAWLGLTPMIPTVAYWFSFMAQAGFDFDYSVQKQLALEYSQLGAGGATNVLDVFSGLTQCSVESLKTWNNSQNIAPDNHTGCTTSVVDVYNDLQSSVYGKGTDGCVKVFVDNKDKKWNLTDPGAVRTMLWICFEANPFNTFIGLGWNSYPNPLVCVKPQKQTNDEHYTGKEYVIKNRKFGKALSPVKIKLATATADSNKDLVTNGFCS